MASTAATSSSTGKSKYVRLITNDDHEFVIERALVEVAPTIRAMMEGPSAEGGEQETVPPVYFRDIDSCTMVVVCKYFTYKHKYTNSGTEIPGFEITADNALQVLMAANFLDC